MKNKTILTVLTIAIIFGSILTFTSCKDDCPCPCEDQFSWSDSDGNTYLNEVECQSNSGDPGSCFYKKTYDCSCDD